MELEFADLGERRLGSIAIALLNKSDICGHSTADIDLHGRNVLYSGTMDVSAERRLL